jgi:hypothetical protein
VQNQPETAANASGRRALRLNFTEFLHRTIDIRAPQQLQSNYSRPRPGGTAVILPLICADS